MTTAHRPLRLTPRGERVAAAVQQAAQWAAHTVLAAAFLGVPTLAPTLDRLPWS